MILAALALLLLPLGALAQGYSGVRQAAPAPEPAVVVSPLQAERDRLATAIVAGDRARVAAWVRPGRTLDFNFNDELPRGRTGESPLTIAVNRGRPDIVRTLIEAGADVRRKDGFGQAPIHVAKSADMVALLVNAGADPNAEDATGVTAAVRALDLDNAAVLDALLASGGRLAAAARGPDLFTRALERRKPGQIPILLERGADPRVPPTQALWPLIEKGDVENARRLLRAGADPDAHNDREWLLGRALFRRQWEIAEALLDAGASARLPDAPMCAQSGAFCNSTQAIRSASFHLPMLLRLKASGLDLDIVAADGKTALAALIIEQPMAIRAVSPGRNAAAVAVNPATGEQVVRQGSAAPAVRDIPAPDNAARVRALLDAGADPNAKVRDLTPLMVALGVAGDRREIVEALLRAGAKIEFDAPVAPYRSDAPIAPYRPDAPFAAQLQGGQNLLTGMRVGPLGWAVLHGRSDVALRIVGRDRRTGPADRNLPYFAADAGDWELLLAILPHASDVNVANRAKVTPLMLAADAGHAEAVRALVAAGADVNARSARAWPPLPERNLREEFAAGLAGHSPPKPRLVGGITALRAAKARGHSEVARLLVEAGGKE